MFISLFANVFTCVLLSVYIILVSLSTYTSTVAPIPVSRIAIRSCNSNVYQSLSLPGPQKYVE